MWIFTPESFISIVDKGDPSGRTLLVRARMAGDIERHFPDATVTNGGGTDYRFRARINRESVAQAMADQVRQIGYRNFKDEVSESDRHDAYLDVWRAMYRFQERG